jgi:hypothetical protein
MRKRAPLFIFPAFFIFLGSMILAVPITFYLSNSQVSVNLKPTFISLEVGYPYSSVKIGDDYYAELKFKESTPVIYVDAGITAWKNALISLSLGATVKAGKISDALNNDKISEIGRNYLWTKMNFSFGNVKADFSYSRFFSSIAKNISKDIFFLSPPNYNGEESNDAGMKFTYSFPLQQDFEVALTAKSILRFSDAFVFKDPLFEFGISLSTTLEDLQRSF